MLITIISCDYLNLALANEYVGDVTIPTQVISITNVAPGRLANQITVIKLNYSKIQRVSTGIRFSLESVFYLCLKHALLHEQIPAM